MSWYDSVDWGDLFSAYGAYNSASKDRSYSQDMTERNWHYMKTHKQWEMANIPVFAEQLGVNPLSLLGHEGVSTTGKIAQPGNSYARQGAALGKGIGTAINALIQADINYKNASAKALKESSVKKVTAKKDGAEIELVKSPTGMTQTVPSQMTSSTKSNIGMTAGVKPAKDSYVDEYGYIEIVPNQELAEAKESEGAVKSTGNLWYDVNMAIDLATNNTGIRHRLQKTLTKQLRRNGKIDYTQKLKWIDGLQRFKVVPKGKSKKKILRNSTKNYIKKRNKRESNKFWW